MRAALAALLLLLAVPAGAEKFDVETREFYSRNKAFRLSVGYSGSGGGGRARAELYGASGKKISAFEADRPPFMATVSGDGRRLIFFCGSWGQSVTIFTLNVHAASGELLASHQAPMEGPAGEDFSEDHSVYAVGADQGDNRTIFLLETAKGRLLWKKKFKEKLLGLKLSGAGSRLLAVFDGAGDSYRAVVFDKAGKELGSAVIKTANNLTPRVFSRDGGEFELWEDRTVYSEKDGYWHAKLVKKRFFRLAVGGVEETGSKELYEDFK